MLGRILAAGSFLDPKTIIEKVGLFGVWAIVFAESGLLIGFFLPGDSLLFTAGMVAGGAFEHVSGLKELDWNIWVVVTGCFIAAVAGDQVGYVFGRQVGPTLFNRPNSRFFKQSNVEKAQAFFDKYGSKTIVLARFVPIVRTFAPIVAGVSRMHYRTFVMFNIIGGALWAAGVTMLGFWLGSNEVVKDNFEIAILAIVFISLIPIAVELFKARKEHRHPASDLEIAVHLAEDVIHDEDHDLTTPPTHPR